METGAVPFSGRAKGTVPFAVAVPPGLRDASEVTHYARAACVQSIPLTKPENATHTPHRLRKCGFSATWVPIGQRLRNHLMHKQLRTSSTQTASVTMLSGNIRAHLKNPHSEERGPTRTALSLLAPSTYVRTAEFVGLIRKCWHDGCSNKHQLARSLHGIACDCPHSPPPGATSLRALCHTTPLTPIKNEPI